MCLRCHIDRTTWLTQGAAIFLPSVTHNTLRVDDSSWARLIQSLIGVYVEQRWHYQVILIQFIVKYHILYIFVVLNCT